MESQALATREIADNVQAATSGAADVTANIGEVNDRAADITSASSQISRFGQGTRAGQQPTFRRYGKASHRRPQRLKIAEFQDHCFGPKAAATAAERRVCFGPKADIASDRRHYVRSDLKAALTSCAKSCGCSQAAKWPPLSTSLK